MRRSILILLVTIKAITDEKFPLHSLTGNPDCLSPLSPPEASALGTKWVRQFCFLGIEVSHLYSQSRVGSRFKCLPDEFIAPHAPWPLGRAGQGKQNVFEGVP